jgi:ferric-dicitrate binding protein FerR (iron transport regulator)
MSRLPPFSPDDLRDLADDERVDRIWARLAPELPVASARAGLHASARPRFVQLLVAASLSTFAVGRALGHFAGGASSEAELRATSLAESPAIDVLAAGSERRTFVLPSGARVMLEPEALVEVAQHGDGGVSLRLMRGMAAFDASGASGPLAILAGEARLSAPSGSVVSVRRNERDVDVHVAGGAVEIVTPSGRRVVSNSDGELRVPISTVVSRLEVAKEPAEPTPSDWESSRWQDERAERTRATERSPSRNDGPSAADDAPGEVAIVASPPNWLQRYHRYEFDEAYRMLESSGGLSAAIDTAQRAADLMALADIARTKRQTPQALRALDRVVAEFPSDPNATVAAMTLGRMYESMGNRELSAKYFAHAGKSAIFEEDVLCRELRARGGESPPSAGLLGQAKSFLAKFPEGSCRELAESIVAEGVDSGGTAEEPPRAPENEAPKPGSAPSPAPSAAPSAAPSQGGTSNEPQPSAPGGSSPALPSPSP